MKAASPSAACCTTLVRPHVGIRQCVAKPNTAQLLLHASQSSAGTFADRSLAACPAPTSDAAVCGCGLDTVPVPGATQQQTAEERGALLDATAALLLDTAALAFRLNKPLSARLLPVPGGRAGQLTAFDSPYLLNCKLLPLD